LLQGRNEMNSVSNSIKRVEMKERSERKKFLSLYTQREKGGRQWTEKGWGTKGVSGQQLRTQNISTSTLKRYCSVAKKLFGIQ